MKKIIAILVIVPVLIVVGFGAWVYLSIQPEEPVAKLPSPSSVRSTLYGEIKGVSDSYETHAWLGIPYAKAQRWQAPRRPDVFDARYEAYDFGDPCPQVGLLGEARGQVVGSEDCLALNIWAPKAVRELVPTGDDLMPVMFWIHGGGNSIGEAGTSFYNGASMSGEHQVVVVSINYRLGPFGWFSHPALRETASTPESASGNFGTLDIIQALDWVKQNIRHFGGDPDNVTIYGESAGGFNVLSMMVSPLAGDLFDRAIVQSGGLSLTPVNVAENFVDDVPSGHEFSSKETVNRLLMADGRASDRDAAKLLQLSMSAEEIMNYLRGKTAQEIIGAYMAGAMGMLSSPDLFADGYVLPATTDVEQMFSDVANYNDVPVILGTNRDEVKLFMMLDDANVEKVFGFPWQIRDKAKYERDNRYGSDSWKARGVDELASLMREAQGPTVFAYRFDADDLRNLGVIDLKELVGAAHAMEIPYVFGNFGGPLDFIHPPSFHDERDVLSAAMMSYWAEFAYTGDPGDGRHGEHPEWKPWQNTPPRAERVIIFDNESDGGVRMSSLRLSRQAIKERFLADDSFSSQEAWCEAYRRTFRGDDFIESEYRHLGQGCKQ